MALKWWHEDKGVLPRFVFEGALDAEADLSELKLPFDRVVFDMAGVSSADRGGARALLGVIGRLRIDQSVEVRRCPAHVLDFLRRTPALAMRLIVRSTTAQVYCQSCGAERPVLVRVPDGLSVAAMNACDSCGGTVAPTASTHAIIEQLCNPQQARRPRQPTQPPPERAPRHRVHLAIRYRTAADFVEDYAQDLSHGGLFIKSAEHIAVGDEVEVEVELPGFGSFTVNGRVAHKLSAMQAAENDKRPGAGIEVTDAPEEFQAALSRYLERLGRRRDARVVVTNPLVKAHLERLGYGTTEVASTGDLTAAIAHAPGAVIGVIVGRREQNEFTAALAPHGLDDIVTSIDYLEEIDELLPELDDRLPL